MTNLPISTNIPAAQTPGKPAGTDDSTAQGSDGFSQVLARQVSDSTAPAEKKADAATAENVAPADKEAALAPELAASLPADMLAALLVQQNTASTAQPAANLQPAVNSPAASDTMDSNTAGSALMQKPDLLQATTGAAPAGTATVVAGATAVLPGTAPQIPLTDTAEKRVIAQAALAAQKDTRQPLRNAPQGPHPFADALNSTGKNEIIPASNSELARNISTAEITASVQHSAETVLVTPQAAPAPGLRDASNSGTLTVNTPVNQSGWDSEFSQQVTWLATQRNQSAELHLNPPQLGPLDVVIKVSADQATAMFTSPHAAVREAIEQALPKLREMLADSGIMLGNATVSDQAPRREQNEFSRAQQGGSTASGRSGEAAPAMVQGERVSSLPRHNGMVDTFA